MEERFTFDVSSSSAAKAKHKDFCSYSSSSRKQTFGCGMPKTMEAKHLKYESFARQHQLVYTIF